MYDYLVVGAGLYGAVFAHEAKKHGKSVLVIDKRSNIAGNVYTEDIEKIIFQLLDNWKNTQYEGGDENRRNFAARLLLRNRSGTVLILSCSTPADKGREI